MLTLICVATWLHPTYRLLKTGLSQERVELYDEAGLKLIRGGTAAFATEESYWIVS